MDYILNIMERLAERKTAGNIKILPANNNVTIPVPISGIYAVILVSNEKTEFLVGDDCGLCTESVDITVMCAERDGERRCRKTAEIICLELTRLDSEKRITSVAAEKCRYNEEHLAYEITLSFGLRPERRHGGDRDLQ